MVTAAIAVVEPVVVYRYWVPVGLMTPMETVAARKAEKGAKRSKKQKTSFRVSGIQLLRNDSCFFEMINNAVTSLVSRSLKCYEGRAFHRKEAFFPRITSNVKAHSGLLERYGGNGKLEAATLRGRYFSWKHEKILFVPITLCFSLLK